MTLAERKAEAVQDFYGSVRLTRKGVVAESAAQVAAKIRKLSAVVRSPKWQGAVEDYAQFVESHADDVHWAFGQGSVYFAYAIV